MDEIFSHFYIIGCTFTEPTAEHYLSRISHVSVAFAHYDETKGRWIVAAAEYPSCAYSYNRDFSDSFPPGSRLRKQDSIEKDLFCTDEIIRSGAAQLIRFVEEYTETQTMKDWNE